MWAGWHRLGRPIPKAGSTVFCSQSLFFTTVIVEGSLTFTAETSLALTASYSIDKYYLSSCAKMLLCSWQLAFDRLISSFSGAADNVSAMCALRVSFQVRGDPNAALHSEQMKGFSTWFMSILFTWLQFTAFGDSLSHNLAFWYDILMHPCRIA